MPSKKKIKPKASEASPTKSLSDELGTLRRNLGSIVRVYEQKLKADLESVAAWNEEIAKLAKPSREQIRDLADMLGLLRKAKLKPEKGRRRDLRKIDSIIEDLVHFCRPK